MIRAAASVCADRNTDDAAHRPLAVAEVTRAADFGEQLVESGPDVIGKLHFDDRLASCSAHADSASDDEGFLDRCVEHAVVAEFFCKCSSFAENAAQSFS